MNYNVEEIVKKLEGADAIFFDLDGTLIDTEPLYFRFWNEACEFYGYKLTKEQLLAMRSRDPKLTREFLSEISNGELDYDVVKAKRIELMDAYLEEHPMLLKKGVKLMLDYFFTIGKELYIVSANTVEKSKNILEKLCIYDYFTDIVSAKDVKNGKPAPDVYLKALEQTGLDKKSVIVFEDSPNGLMSAHKAGLFTVMVEDMTPYEEDMDYVDGAVESFDSLLAKYLA